MGRRRHTCNCPISGNEYLTNPFRSLLSRANGHQRACDVPDHVVQKRVGLDVYYDKIALPGYRNPFQKSNRGSGLAAGGPE